MSLDSCPVCNHLHRGMIEYLLEESPNPINRIASFYELTEKELRDHQVQCMCSLGGRV